MGAIASQITSLTIVYSIVYSGADHRNIKAPRHWSLCGEFTGDRWIPRTNGQWRGKSFHLMTSSCIQYTDQNLVITVDGPAASGARLSAKYMAYCSFRHVTTSYIFCVIIDDLEWSGDIIWNVGQDLAVFHDTDIHFEFKLNNIIVSYPIPPNMTINHTDGFMQKSASPMHFQLRYRHSLAKGHRHQRNQCGTSNSSDI